MHAAAATPAPASGPATLTSLRESLQRERAAVVAAFRENLRPDAFLNGLRRLVDRTLIQLLEIHPLPAGAALAAVGGYGRGELYPYSDVDILILLPEAPRAEDESAVSDLLTALWDLGLEPGHSVRTVAQCLEEAAADITVETALLEARFLAGSRALMRTFTQQMQKRMDPRAFVRTKKLEMQQRHTRYENTPYALEPNCKESPGGLRDLQVILWMARAAGFGRTWRQIADAGLLTPQEARHLRRAEQAFKRLRIELHLLAGRREDRVIFDHQSALARVYEIPANSGRRPSEVLMQRYYWAAKLVTQLNNILVQNIESRLNDDGSEAEPVEIDEDFVHRRGLLDIRLDDAFERKPTLLLRAFLVMQQHSELTGMSARMVRALWHARRRIDGQFRANPVNRKLFLSLLQQPRGIVHELRRMNDLGVLPQYLPPFRRIVGQMQHDLFHVYTVDQHTLMVVRNLRRFTMQEHAHEYPLCSDLVANFERHWLLYVAALFHDIAKGRGGDHSELGAVDVRRFARSHGIDKEDAQLLEFLVRNHLLLSTVAQKQDLSDPAVIRDFADKVGTERRLTALYLLTVADIRGTSPKVWNTWKGKLLESLYRQTLAVLGGATVSTTAVLSQRKQEAASLLRLAGLRDDARDALWQQLDVAYFLRHEASDIAWHTRHLYHKVANPTPVVRARYTEAESLQFMIYARSTADLFTRLCAWFESRRLSIQDARITTTRHGWALDSFVVLSSGSASELRAMVSLLEHDLAAYLDTAEPLPRGASGTIGRASRRSRVFPVTPSIELHPDERGRAWILSMSATDRPGLLHAVARIFDAHALTVSSAKVMTLGERVEDVFVLDGEALTDNRAQLRFEQALLGTLAA
ncbi:[protein-PII] uridylyltransferase [Achromobacter sp. GG226]|uniref:[protein-PII] uridylyltransferase n=1 Tax=Verticiella alkaliphila TaxID=2779529 RepID=UPI001C0BAA14|nr:[protein-PII] uridylyltransferase [Verticiella sp. GG226]MBU4609869.1 [protein-PII] uridylyltransferase [Verticiella sp. GG226]